MKPLRLSTSGSTLPGALIIIFVLGAMIAIALEFTNSIGRNTQGAGAVESGVAVADGVLEYLYAHWRQIARSSSVPAPPTADFAAIPAPPADLFADTTNAVVKNFGVVAVDPLLVPLTGASPTPVKQQTGYAAGSYSYTYLASADVDVAVAGRIVEQKVRRVFQKKIQSPWNFALFYQEVLELHPAAALVLTGRIHSNDDVYTGSNKLTIVDQLTTSGSWNIGYAPGDGQHAGTATAPNYPANLPPAQLDAYQPFALDAQLLNTIDKNPNNDSFREIAQVPDTTYDDPFAAQRYYNQAGVKVLINGNTKTIMNEAGTVCTAASKGNDLAIYQAVNAAIRNPQNLQDTREGGTVSAWDVDLTPITGSNMVWNNILYISDQSATPSNRKAIRVRNGAILPRNGLTFVTDNPLYLQGNWNTGANPPSSASTPDSTQPLDASYPWRPSAVIADAVTLLSNAWQDNNSTKGLNQRVASNTTVNAALVAGNVPSGSKGNNYSGGGENFVRFLEDWTGKTFTYYGSMLQLYASAYATGVWGKANVYAPAQMKWYFDDNLTLNAPPGTAVMISYVQQRWFQE